MKAITREYKNRFIEKTGVAPKSVSLNTGSMKEYVKFTMALDKDIQEFVDNYYSLNDDRHNFYGLNITFMRTWSKCAVFEVDIKDLIK